MVMTPDEFNNILLARKRNEAIRNTLERLANEIVSKIDEVLMGGVLEAHAEIPSTFDTEGVTQDKLIDKIIECYYEAGWDSVEITPIENYSPDRDRNSDLYLFCLFSDKVTPVTAT